MGKNIMIPLSLLDQIIEFMQELDLSEYHPLRYEYCEILWALRVKKQKIELHDAYFRIISALDPDDRDDARMQYLQQKRALQDEDDPPF